MQTYAIKCKLRWLLNFENLLRFEKWALPWYFLSIQVVLYNKFLFLMILLFFQCTGKMYKFQETSCNQDFHWDWNSISLKHCLLKSKTHRCLPWCNQHILVKYLYLMCIILTRFLFEQGIQWRAYVKSFNIMCGWF